jgi:hypothetical protein
MLRLFILPEDWSIENVMIVAREVARILGPTEQFDIGITLARHEYNSNGPAAGVTARLTKLDSHGRETFLRISEGFLGDTLYVAQFPRLSFTPADEGGSVLTAAPDAVLPASTV